jgi:pimeloyl-ACP methyl ester carboxylesterase
LLSRRTIDGVEVDVVVAGEGKGSPILFLHGVDGIDAGADWMRLLAAEHEVIAPWHPGFGLTERPQEFRTIADLAYFLLELSEDLDLRAATLIGASFGGWLAAETLVRSSDRFARAVFVDPLGIKVGDRMERHITDMHALNWDDLSAALFHDPARAERDYAELSDDDLLRIARSREAFVIYGWKPYMNNPGLRRWLRRIRIPALVIRGESDGILTREYAEAFAAELPDGRFEAIPAAGHYPHTEQPQLFTEIIERFIAETSAVGPETN